MTVAYGRQYSNGSPVNDGQGNPTYLPFQVDSLGRLVSSSNTIYINQFNSIGTDSSVLINAAIQNKGSGKVILDSPGNIITLKYPIILPSNTSLEVMPGSLLKRAVGTVANYMVRNKYIAGNINLAQAGFAAISGSSPNYILTFVWVNSVLTVGQQIYLRTSLSGGNYINGFYTVTAVTSTTVSVNLGTLNPTLTSGVLWVYDYYQTLANTAFSSSGTSGTTTVTVTQPGHQKQVGDQVFIWGITDTTTNTNYCGPVTVTGVTVNASNVPQTWSYVSLVTTTATTPDSGTAIIQHNHDIEYSDHGISLDGNYNTSSSLGNNDTNIGQTGVVFGNVNRLKINGLRTINCYFRTLWDFNCSQKEIKNVCGYNGRVTIQVDGPSFKSEYENISGTGNDDCWAICNTPIVGGVYDYVVPPSTPYPNNQSSIVCDDTVVSNVNPILHLNAVKIAGLPASSFGTVTLKKLGGTVLNNAVSCIDETAESNFYGATINELLVDGVKTVCGAGYNDIIINQSGLIKKVRIKDWLINTNKNTNITAFSMANSINPMSCDEVIFENPQTNGALGVAAAIGFNNCSINKITINKAYHQANSSNAGVPFLLLGTGLTGISGAGIIASPTVVFNSPTQDGGSSGNNGILVQLPQSGIACLKINDYTGWRSNTLAAVTSGGLNQSLDVHINGAEGYHQASWISGALNGGANLNIYLNNANCLNVGNNLVQVTLAGGTMRVNATDSCNIPSGNAILNSGSSGSFSANGKALKLDASLSRLTSLEGDIFFNTNAALGTLLTASPVIASKGGAGGSGAFHYYLLANPALYY